MSRSQRSQHVVEDAARAVVNLATFLSGASGFVCTFSANRAEACGHALKIPDHEDRARRAWAPERRTCVRVPRGEARLEG